MGLWMLSSRDIAILMVRLYDYSHVVTKTWVLGLLRDHGLTAMMLQGGIDRELTSQILKRAQWLNEQYVRSKVCTNMYCFQGVRMPHARGLRNTT